MQSGMKMGLFTSWTKKDEKEFWKSEMKKARKLAREQRFAQGRAEGRQQGLEQGLEQGQELLVSTIQRLRNGESPKDIKKAAWTKERSTLR